jgi:putative oxidoreductase
VRDTAILVARLLLVALFIHGGWGKLIDFSATVGAMAHRNLPLPWLAAVVAVVMELPIPIAVALGIWTRPLAILLAVYTVATTFIGHPYWEFEGAARKRDQLLQELVHRRGLPAALCDRRRPLRRRSLASAAPLCRL